MRVKKITTPFVAAILISVFICMFALFIHAPKPLQIISWCSFIFTTFFIYLAIENHPDILLQKELWTNAVKYKAVMLQAIIVLAVLAIWYRSTEGMLLLPVSIEWFVILSMLIGITEELIFRGVVQSLLMYKSSRIAIFVSAFVFAAYKALLFVWPSAINQTNPLVLFSISFIAGIYLGYLRSTTNSIWPCLIAHALFDLLVYADTINAPWWVW